MNKNLHILLLTFSFNIAICSADTTVPASPEIPTVLDTTDKPEDLIMISDSLKTFLAQLSEIKNINVAFNGLLNQLKEHLKTSINCTFRTTLTYSPELLKNLQESHLSTLLKTIEPETIITFTESSVTIEIPINSPEEDDESSTTPELNDLLFLEAETSEQTDNKHRIVLNNRLMFVISTLEMINNQLGKTLALADKKEELSTQEILESAVVLNIVTNMLNLDMLLQFIGDRLAHDISQYSSVNYAIIHDEKKEVPLVHDHINTIILNIFTLKNRLKNNPEIISKAQHFMIILETLQNKQQ